MDVASGWSFVDNLPVRLKGRYVKYLLKSAGGELFLVKSYGPGDRLVMLAECSSSALYAKFDALGSVAVEQFAQHSVHGTIQRFLEGFLPISDIERADSHIIRRICKRHVLDWVLSNHDTHRAHVLVSAEDEVRFVDYGQCFKYFGSDMLDSVYYPNRTAGQAEPIYNAVYRRTPRHILADARDDVIEYAKYLESTAQDACWDQLDEYAAESARRSGETIDFVQRVRARIARVTADFTDLWATVTAKGGKRP